MFFVNMCYCEFQLKTGFLKTEREDRTTNIAFIYFQHVQPRFFHASPAINAI